MHRSSKLAVYVTGAWVALAAGAFADDRRVALVIGNGAYEYAGRLDNPVNDAKDITAALEAHGFDVVLGLDVGKQQFEAKLKDYVRKLPGADAAVFFYAGHGLQVSGQNYLLPVDAKLDSERDLDFEALRVDFVLRQMELERSDKTSIVFLDACRNNPLARNLARTMGTRAASLGQGLAQVEAGVGTFVAFSTQPGNVALDGTGRNSPFASALAKRIAEPGRGLGSLMIEVRKDVLAATSGAQVPWDHSALTGEFYFDRGARAGASKAGGADSGGAAGKVDARIEKLEQELKIRDDRDKHAAVERLKEKQRQIESQNKRDWQRIFDLRRKAMRDRGTEASRELEREAMDIQMQISRRGQDVRDIASEVEKLEAAARDGR